MSRLALKFLIIAALVLFVFAGNGKKRCRGGDDDDDECKKNRRPDGGVAVLETTNALETPEEEAQVEWFPQYTYHRPQNVETYPASVWKVYWRWFQFLEHGVPPPPPAKNKAEKEAANIRLIQADVAKIIRDNLAKPGTQRRVCSFSCLHVEDHFKSCKCKPASRVLYSTLFERCPEKVAQVSQDDLSWALKECIANKCECPSEIELLAEQRAQLAFRISSNLTSVVTQASNDKLDTVINNAISSNTIGTPSKPVIEKARKIASTRAVRHRASFAFRRSELYNRLVKGYSKQCKFPVFRRVCREVVLFENWKVNFCNYQGRWLCTPKNFNCPTNRILEHCQVIYGIEICRKLCKPDNYDAWVKNRLTLIKKKRWNPAMDKFASFRYQNSRIARSNNDIRDVSEEEEVLNVVDIDEEVVQNTGVQSFQQLVNEYFKIAPKN